MQSVNVMFQYQRALTHFQVLGNIENSCDVQRALFVEIPERVCEVAGLYLPDAHEHKLVVGMAAQEHGQQLA